MLSWLTCWVAALGGSPLGIPAPPRVRPTGAELAPGETVGALYERVAVWTYVGPVGPEDVLGHYLPYLRRLGYKEASAGYSGGPGLDQDFWLFERDVQEDDVVVITLADGGTARSRYSIASEVVEAPPRPPDTLVPDGATRLVATGRRTAYGRDLRRSLGPGPELDHLVALVDGLPVGTFAGHGGIGDAGQAKLVFAAGGRSYTFTEWAGFGLVSGPGRFQLADPRLGLWRAILSLLGRRGGR